MIAIVGALLVSLHTASAAHYAGALIIGDTRYSVNIEIAREKPKAVKIEISIFQSIHQVALAVAEVRADGGTLTMNGQTFDLPPTLAWRWWQQVTEEALESAGFTCHTAGHVASICETPVVASFMQGFPAKARLLGRRAQRNVPAPEEIRIFSLEEWDNLFREYVSIGISRIATEEKP